MKMRNTKKPKCNKTRVDCSDKNLCSEGRQPILKKHVNFITAQLITQLPSAVLISKKNLFL